MHLRALTSSRSVVRMHRDASPRNRGFMVPSGHASRPGLRCSLVSPERLCRRATRKLGTSLEIRATLEVCADLQVLIYMPVRRLNITVIKAAASAQATYAGVRSSGPSAVALDRSASDYWRSCSCSCHHRPSRAPSCGPGRCRPPLGCIYVAGPPCAASGTVRRPLLQLRSDHRGEERAKTARKGAEW